MTVNTSSDNLSVKRTPRPIRLSVQHASCPAVGQPTTHHHPPDIVFDARQPATRPSNPSRIAVCGAQVTTTSPQAAPLPTSVHTCRVVVRKQGNRSDLVLNHGGESQATWVKWPICWLTGCRGRRAFPYLSYTHTAYARMLAPHAHVTCVCMHVYTRCLPLGIS